METTPRHALAEIRAMAARRNAPLILELDLTVDPVEGIVDDPLTARFGRRRQTLREIVDGLRRAALDPRTRVLVAHVASCGMPIARVQEIRDAVAELRAAGKFAIAYADTFGEFGGGTVPYYLACAFDQIWLAPPGDLGLTGVASHTPFLRDALDRLGVATELGARHEYKNAVNTFLERGFTSAHLEATTRVVESSADEIIAGVVAGRRLPADRVRRLVDAGPLSAQAALRAGLVDRLGYRDEVYAAVRRRAAATDPTEPLPETSGPSANGVGGPAEAAALPPEPTPPAAVGAAAAVPPPGSASAAGSADLGGVTAASAGAGADQPAGADAAAATARTDPAAPAAEPGRTPPVGAPTAVPGASPAPAAAQDAPGRRAAPVPLYLATYRRSAARKEASPLRRAARSSGAAVASLLGPDRREARRSATVPGPTGLGELDEAVAVPADRDPGTAAVALIHGTGPVVLRRTGPPVGGRMLAADTVCAAFRAAAKDPDIAAAVFRVDSPGGSYVASDLVRREVERFRASGRPVIVSMGSVAASGGYFVALAADTIVASPSTLTGSIGVYGGKQVISGLLDKLGVAIGEVAQGEHALMMSARRPFSPGERAKLDEFLDRVYADFVGKVAIARAMSLERADELARGRVWTGADAHRHGLVDELGGLEHALRLAWTTAGLPGARPSRVRLLPHRSLVDHVRPARSSEDAAAGFGDGTGVHLAGGLVGAALGLTGPSAAPMAGGMDAALVGALEALAGGWAGVLSGGHAGGWGPLAGLAARAGLPAAGPLLMPPIGPVG
ncbi:signal peptide peptidase SppA [Pseudofrankia sp. DC12]|uniref:signal peptide peptidase SppA n=1 Tax=Pseudofrankia sp. DC12 TaxID=683315 RepID=UPI0005F76D90|nr:signal peptide peptidase SppA [Pseudofrankia sp. DC12]